MTKPKSSNLSVNEKLSRNLQNQVQQRDLKLFWYMDFGSKSRTQSQSDGTQVQQLECEWKIVKKFTEPSSETCWNCFDIWSSGGKAENTVKMTELNSSNSSVNEKLSRKLPNQVQQLDLKLFWYMEFRSKCRKHSQNDGTKVQQLECEWKNVKKFTKPSPATWFEFVLIYGIQVEKPKNRVEMTEHKSSNLSVNEKLSINLPNQVQQLDLKLFWYMEFRSKSRKQSQHDGTQVRQLQCEWEIVKKFTKPSPATWFEIVLIYGIQFEKPKTELKWRNPSPATWVWIKNCQEIYQTKSCTLICNCFDNWNSGRKAENIQLFIKLIVEMNLEQNTMMNYQLTVWWRTRTLKQEHFSLTATNNIRSLCIVKKLFMNWNV